MQFSSSSSSFTLSTDSNSSQPATVDPVQPDPEEVIPFADYAPLRTLARDSECSVLIHAAADATP